MSAAFWTTDGCYLWSTNEATYFLQDDKKLIRYREGKIVSTKGERFSQVTKEESQEMKKSIVNIHLLIWQLTLGPTLGPGTIYTNTFFARCVDRRSDNFSPASWSFDVGVVRVSVALILTKRSLVISWKLCKLGSQLKIFSRVRVR